MREYIRNIKTKIAYMSRKEKLEYILTYYWYHILGLLTVIGLIIFLILHFGFGEKKPEFTCVMVNQQIDYDRDEALAGAFGKVEKIPEDRIVISSDYLISYEDVKLEDENKSSYEKFFFQWSGQELDAVIMTEDFYRYCKKMNGTFRDMDTFDTGNLTLYEDGAKKTGIRIEGTKLEKILKTDKEETWILVFPANGTHKNACQKFIDYIGDGK